MAKRRHQIERWKSLKAFLFVACATKGKRKYEQEVASERALADLPGAGYRACTPAPSDLIAQSGAEGNKKTGRFLCFSFGASRYITSAPQDAFADEGGANIHRKCCGMPAFWAGIGGGQEYGKDEGIMCKGFLAGIYMAS